jgi:indolepyruvate ferredoxin oxidoreductase alpha subunit
VVISRRACALLPEQRRAYHALAVDADKCLACGACRRLGCPALVKSDLVHARTGRPKTAIDPLLCTGCGICAQVCSAAAIVRPVLESEEVV